MSQNSEQQPCRWCAQGDTPKFLDADGTLVSITGNEGILSHAHEEYWWPCLKFGVEMRSIGISPASAAPVVDEKALKKRARQIIDAVIESPVIIEVRTFSQPEEVDKLKSRVAALLQKSIPAAATAAPVEQSDETEALRDTNILCRSGEGRPKVEIWFKDLKAAQRIHKWLVSLAANANEGAH